MTKIKAKTANIFKLISYGIVKIRTRQPKGYIYQIKWKTLANNKTITSNGCNTATSHCLKFTFSNLDVMDHHEGFEGQLFTNE